MTSTPASEKSLLSSSRGQWMKTLIYYLAVSVLFTHEIDAALNAEWRLLYGLSALKDQLAADVFVALHIPIFLLVMYLSQHPRQTLRSTFRALVAMFLVVHGALHFMLSDRPLYQFSGIDSNLYIFAGAILGLVYLLWSSLLDRS